MNTTSIVSFFLNILLVIGLGFYAFTHQQPVSLGDGYGTNTHYSIPTNSTATVGSSTLVVATSTSRNFIQISNDSANVVYISIGETSVIGRGIRIPVNGSFTMKSDDMFTAAIYGTALASSTISYTESVKQ